MKNYLRYNEFKLVESMCNGSWNIDSINDEQLNELNIPNIMKTINLRSKALMTAAQKRATNIKTTAAEQAKRLNKSGHSDQAIKIKAQADEKAEKILNATRDQIAKMKQQGQETAARAKDAARRAAEKAKKSGIKTTAKPTTNLPM